MLTRENLAKEITEIPELAGLSQGDALMAVNHIVHRFTEAMRNGRPVRFRGSFSVRTKVRKVPVKLGSSETKEMRVITVALSTE